jgi:hypothetical protein
MEEHFLDERKMQELPKSVFNKDIFCKMSKEYNCVSPYFFGSSIKRYMKLTELCSLSSHMLDFQEVIIYFGNGKGYFQAQDSSLPRKTYLLSTGLL